MFIIITITIIVSLVTGRNNGDPHRPGFKFQTAALSILCVMFLVYRGADKSSARPGRKQTNVCVIMA